MSSQRSQKVKTPVNLTRKEQLGSLTPNYKPKSKLDLERERLTKQLKGVDKVLEVQSHSAQKPILKNQSQAAIHLNENESSCINIETAD